MKIFVRKSSFIDKDKKKVEYDEFYAPVLINKMPYEVKFKLGTKLEKDLVILNIESCELVVVNATFTDKEGKQVDYEKAEIQFKLNGTDTSIQLSGIYKPDLYIIKLYNSLINKK